MKRLFQSLLVAISLCIAAQGATAQTVDSGYLQRSEYQAWLDSGVTGNLVPVFAEAVLYYGHVRYRAVFGPAPAGLRGYQLRTGRDDAAFAALNAEYLGQGYQLFHHQRFNTEGHLLNQGIWYRY